MFMRNQLLFNFFDPILISVGQPAGSKKLNNIRCDYVRDQNIQIEVVKKSNTTSTKLLRTPGRFSSRFFLECGVTQIKQMNACVHVEYTWKISMARCHPNFDV